MQVISTNKEELVKYLIHLGAKEREIVSHLRMDNSTEEEALALISALIRRKEVFRDENDRFYLANDPAKVPEHIIGSIMSRSVKLFRAQFA